MSTQNYRKLYKKSTTEKTENSRVMIKWVASIMIMYLILTGVYFTYNQ